MLIQDCPDLIDKVMNNLPDAVIIIDLEGRITDASRLTLELYGFSSAAELVGKNFCELLAPESCEEARVYFHEVLSDPGLKNIEYEFVRSDGTHFAGISNLSLIRRSDGQPEAFIAFVREYTGHDQGNVSRESEAISQDVNGTRFLGSSTAFLQRLASIGKLSINLAHELNNPLDGARRYMQLLLDQMTENGRTKAYAERSLDGITRSLKMVRGVLDFARNTKSTSRLTDIKYSIRKALSLFADKISAQNIKVKTEFGNNIPVLKANLDHVFINIIRNAIEAMPDGGSMSIKTSIPASQMLEIRFTDTGSGIEDDMLDRIFDPFFTTKDFGQCVGLGLSISREIIGNCGGSLSVESELDKGTTFIVRLPISKGRVLVMDDEKYIRDLTGNMLSHLGYSVVTSIDGAEAFELYKEAAESGQPYDVVILDLVVPGGMGGREAAQRLLKLDPEVKAIACSGYPDDPVLIDFEKYGFKGTIAKPYVAEQLSEELHEVVMGKRT